MLDHQTLAFLGALETRAGQTIGSTRAAVDDNLERSAHLATLIRQDIHRHPELAFAETRTAAMVAALLRMWGIEVHEGIGRTGVVGVMRFGNHPEEGPGLGLRADMDALPIEEQTGKPYSSVRRGLMHACGHDGHTAALLGAARHLSGLKAQGACSQWNGTLHLIFQPAEECGLDGGGALAMMRDGLFERFPCERIFAMHNAPSQPVGKVLTRAGPMMASSDRVDVTIRGEGGHAAFPHRSADPVLAVAALVMSLQSIVSRNVDPQDTAVISVGRMLAGERGTYNVIPALARLELSVRALDAQVRVLLERRIGELARLQSESFNCSAQVNYMHGYPVLVNDASCSALVEKVARECFGSTMVDGQTSAITGSEDFASMLEVRPGCYFLMGNGNAPGSCMVHHPGYDFNDELLPASIRMWIGLCREVFNGARFP